jgi:porin
LISLEIDAGLTFKGLLPGRELDILGVGTSFGRIGDARRLDQDEVQFTGIQRPVRDYEAVLEVTYEAHIAPWLALQPDLQLVFHPGGYISAPPPAPAGQPIPNALVIGLRSAITF